MDINSILGGMTANAQQQIGAASRAQEAFNAGTDYLISLQGTAESQAAELAKNTEAMGMDSAAVNYAVNKGREANAAIAGMNPDDQNNLYVQSLAKITESWQAQDAAKAEYRKLDSVNLLDNPLGYIMAQLKLPQVAKTFNNALEDEQTANARMLGVVQKINAKDTLIAANTADALLKIDTQKSKQATLQAQMQLSKLQQDNVSTIGQRTVQALQIGSVGFQAQKDMLNVQMDAEKFKLQQESVQLQREQAFEFRQEQLKKKNMEAEAQAEVQERYKAAAAMLGYASVPDLKAMDAKSRDRFVKVASSLQLGNDVYDSLQTIQTIGNKQVMAQTNGGLGEMVQGSAVAIRIAADQYKARAENKTRTLKAGEAEQEGAKAWQFDAAASGNSLQAPFPINNPRWDTQFNPYKPKYFAVIDAAKAGAIPALKDNVVISIIDALPRDPSASNLTGKQLETVVQTLAQRVANKTLGADKAAQDLVTLNKIGATMNEEQLGYTVLGLPAQQRLVLNVPGTAVFSDPQKMDAMDLASTKSALVKMAAQISAAKNFGEAVSGFVPQRMGGGFDLLNLGLQTVASQPATKK